MPAMATTASASKPGVAMREQIAGETVLTMAPTSSLSRGSGCRLRLCPSGVCPVLYPIPRWSGGALGGRRKIPGHCFKNTAGRNDSAQRPLSTLPHPAFPMSAFLNIRNRLTSIVSLTQAGLSLRRIYFYAVELGRKVVRSSSLAGDGSIKAMVKSHCGHRQSGHQRLPVGSELLALMGRVSILPRTNSSGQVRRRRNHKS